MKKNIAQNPDKLKLYSAFASIFIFSALKSEAQTNIIEYTDIDPDLSFTFTDEPYLLDLNNDGFADFSLSANKSTYYYVSSGYNIFFQVHSVYIQPAEGNFVAGNYSGSGSSGFAFPSAFNAGDAIDNELSWQSPVKQYLAAEAIVYISSSLLGTFSTGDWAGGLEDKYLGMKFSVAGDIYYGWLRVDVNEDNHSYAVKDYAYNTVAEQEILAGQNELLGLHDLLDPSLLSIYAFDKILHIIPKDLQATENTVRILDVAGQTLYAGGFSRQGAQINCALYSAGIYLVHIESDGKTLTKKIILN